MFNTKVIIGLIIALIAGGGYYAWEQKTKTINDLANKVTVVTISQKSAEDTAIKTEGANKITQAIEVSIVEKTIATAAKQDIIREKIISNVSKIEKEYFAKPQTYDYQKQIDVETSTVMINGFWDAYCQGIPNAAGCNKPL